MEKIIEDCVLQPLATIFNYGDKNTKIFLTIKIEDILSSSAVKHVIEIDAKKYKELFNK